MAKSLNKDEVNLSVVLDGSPMRKELAKVDQSIVETRDRVRELKNENVELAKAMKAAPKGSDEYRKAVSAIAANTGELKKLEGELATSTSRAAELRKEIGIGALSVRELRNESAKLRILRDTATGGSAAWAKFDQQLTAVNARIKVLTNDAARQEAAWESVRHQYKLSEMSMAQLEMEAKRLGAALHTMQPGDAGFAKLRNDLKLTEAQLAATRSGLSPFQRAWQGVKSSVVGTFAGVGALFAGGAFLSGIKSWVTSSAKLSDAQAEVRRTTGLTKADVDDLTKSLGKLNTRTARSELLALAKDAGKLGITGKNDVLAFVAAGDKLNVALGEELGEGAIEQIGKLNQTFKVTERSGYSLSKAMLASGSAINDLANASTADGAFMVDYATRLGGVNTQANISIENTLGYAAALDQLGQQSETSSTAISRFTLGAFKDTAEYAKIAGMSVGDFTKLLKTDTNEALLRTLKGLNGNKEGLEVMTKKFADMGQEGARSVGVLASLANNTELIRKQQDIANKSFSEGTSVINAFNSKNQTLGANLDIIGRKLAGAFVNSSVVKGINSIVASLRDWVSVPVSETMEQERMELLKTEARIFSYNVGNKERTRLIKELQTMYPNFLRNIDAETVGQERVRDAVAKLNGELVNKIILQKQDEKVQEQLEVQAKRKQQLLDQEDEVYAQMAEIVDRYHLQVKAGVPILEQAKDIQHQMTLEVEKAGQVQRNSFEVQTLTAFGSAVFDLQRAQQKWNSEVDEGNQLAKAREALMKRLGITSTAPVAAPANPVAPTDDGATPDDLDSEAQKKRDAALKAMEQLRADLQKLRRDMELDGMSADEREIAKLDDKFAEIRQKTLANTAHTQQDLTDLENVYEDARAELLTQQADERERKAVEAMQKSMQAVQDAEDAYWEGQLGGEDAEITAQMQRMDTLVGLYEKAGVDTQDLVRRTEEAIAGIRKKYRDQEKKDARDAAKQAFQDQVKTYRTVAGALGSVNDLLQASYDATGKKNYEQTVAAKSLGLMQIAISSGIGVAEAIKAGAGIPFPANIGAIATGVGAVLSGIASAIALLNKSTPQPKSDSGSAPAAPAINNVPLGADGTVLQGPSHRNKGMAVINNQTGEQTAELEGGELVMSKRFTDANADQLPALLAASKAGARLTFLSAPVQRINVAAYQQAARAVKMADGGIIGSSALLEAITAGGNSTPAPQVDGKVAQLLEALNDRVDRLTEVSAANRTAELRLNHSYDDTLNTWDRLKKRNTIRRA